MEDEETDIRIPLTVDLYCWRDFNIHGGWDGAQLGSFILNRPCEFHQIICTRLYWFYIQRLLRYLQCASRIDWLVSKTVWRYRLMYGRFDRSHCCCCCCCTFGRVAVVVVASFTRPHEITTSSFRLAMFLSRGVWCGRSGNAPLSTHVTILYRIYSVN